MNIDIDQIQAASIPVELDEAGGARLLTINVGSSSLKFALFAPGNRPRRLLSGRVERIGTAESRLVMSAAGCGQAVDLRVEAPDQAAAVGLVLDRLRGVVGLDGIAVVGHRVVHGGDRFHRPERITPEVLDVLRQIVPYDPDHLPGEIGAMAAALGGLENLVFAGGIGEHSAEARRLICAGMEFLGIVPDERRNAAGAPLISAPDARVAVHVIPTDEESIIARSAAEFMARPRVATGPSS